MGVRGVLWVRVQVSGSVVVGEVRGGLLNLFVAIFSLGFAAGFRFHLRMLFRFVSLSLTEVLGGLGRCRM